MPWHKRFDPTEVPEYKENTKYSNKDLELMAELLLREDARTEMCRTCPGSEFGKETGHFRVKEQFDKEGEPVLTEEGEPLRLKFPEFICDKGHKWFKGEGRAKGTRGKNPILFDEHIIQRKRREINPTEGVPDPSIVKGMYWRSHEGGRVVNSTADRKKRGLGFYR